MDAKRRALLLAGLASAGATKAWAQPSVARAPEIEAPDTLTDPDTRLDVAFDQHDHMTAPVTINGAGPYPFLIDTGSNVSCVSTRLAADLQLQAGPVTRVHTAVGAKLRPSVVIDRLQVGARNRRSVKAPSLPLWSGDQSGVLGVDWLKGQRLALDFKSKSVEIGKSRTDQSKEGQIVVGARRRHGQLTIVDADMNPTRISAMIDSGSEITICNDALRAIVDAKVNTYERRQMIGLETLAGESFRGQMIYLPFLRLGGLQLGNVPAAHVNMHIFKLWDLDDRPALILGMDLLRQFSCVTLDFGRSTVRFDV
ncbi:retroviral-like aspartic protease family protein [Phenylobacterium immobile]|uniref:retroviral-like aspartic protease family protein n=1 Tax=Phenylobacterium immobile TaxID=21 RepID=UPI000B324DF2|nr:retroviral-like aspartic protease family protein [Phenylobacterium immobile]